MNTELLGFFTKAKAVVAAAKVAPSVVAKAMSSLPVPVTSPSTVAFGSSDAPPPPSDKDKVVDADLGDLFSD